VSALAETSRSLDARRRCYYAGDPTRRPDCEGWATTAYGPVALCPSCDARRSTVGKGVVARSLVTGASWSALETVEAAVGRLRAAEDQLVDAVVSARRLGHSWSELGNALGVSRQAAQQRFGHPAREGRESL
jgi:hypothetical protein